MVRMRILSVAEAASWVAPIESVMTSSVKADVSTRETLERIAATEPETLACMHGSAWRGKGGDLIRALADVVA